MHNKSGLEAEDHTTWDATINKTEDTDPMGCILKTAQQKRLERERTTLSWLVSVVEAAGGDVTV